MAVCSAGKSSSTDSVELLLLPAFWLERSISPEFGCFEDRRYRRLHRGMMKSNVAQDQGQLTRFRSAGSELTRCIPVATMGPGFLAF
jgi:hypothetical protein